MCHILPPDGKTFEGRLWNFVFLFVETRNLHQVSVSQIGSEGHRFSGTLRAVTWGKGFHGPKSLGVTVCKNGAFAAGLLRAFNVLTSSVSISVDGCSESPSVRSIMVLENRKPWFYVPTLRGSSVVTSNKSLSLTEASFLEK